MRRARTAAAAVALAVTGLLAGCAVPGPATGQETAGGQPLEAEASPTTNTALTGSITVDAAASLSTVFPTLAKAFREEYPGARVDFNFGGSSDLANAIVTGAPADVFASASKATMATVSSSNRTTSAVETFARNKLEIAVPKGNPGDIQGLADFGDADKTIVVCAKPVPCGAAAQKVFDEGKIDAQPDSYEKDVTAVLTKVRLGEADAGLVYVTDVKSAGADVVGIEFPEADQAITDYQIATLAGSENQKLAQAWVDFIADKAAPELTKAGFLAP